MTAKEYIPWLKRRKAAGQLELGFAHYYIDRSTIARIEDTYNGAWATANKDGNMNYISYEVVQSYYGVISDALFKENEAMVFRQAAEDLQYYKLPINRNTVRLHKEFSSTSCPHRSSDIHGHTINAVKDYYISQLKYYASKGKTVNEMLKNEGKTGSTAPSAPVQTTPQPDGKTLVVGKQAKQWAKESGGTNIPSFVIGARYDVLASKPTTQSKSKKMYLIGKGKVATGWLLEQDVEGFKQAGGGNTDKATPSTKPTVTAPSGDSIVKGIQANVGTTQDGWDGPNTRKGVIKLFQRGVGTADDGIVGNNTLNKAPVIRSGSQGWHVYAVQAMLYLKGYKSVGKPDKVWGAKSIQACKNFQKDSGLSADGTPGRNTYARLMK